MNRSLHDKIDKLLAAERGATRKPRDRAVSVALAYPNIYRVGMSLSLIHI